MEEIIGGNYIYIILLALIMLGVYFMIRRWDKEKPLIV